MGHASKKKIPLRFFQSFDGVEPVRDWLKSLDVIDRHAIGLDLMRAQWRWPIGMPLCRPLGGGLWEVRTALPSRRIARVPFCFVDSELVALHGFIKKTQKIPDVELELAHRRRKEMWK